MISSSSITTAIHYLFVVVLTIQLHFVEKSSTRTCSAKFPCAMQTSRPFYKDQAHLPLSSVACPASASKGTTSRNCHPSGHPQGISRCSSILHTLSAAHLLCQAPQAKSPSYSQRQHLLTSSGHSSKTVRNASFLPALLQKYTKPNGTAHDQSGLCASMAPNG